MLLDITHSKLVPRAPRPRPALRGSAPGRTAILGLSNRLGQDREPGGILAEARWRVVLPGYYDEKRRAETRRG